MKRVNKTTKKGFTLLEVMLVVAILTILASIAFINVGDTIEHAKMNQSSQQSKFQTQVEEQNNYVRNSILYASARHPQA